MAEIQKQTNFKDVGNATDSSLNLLPDHGVSAVPDVSQIINQDDSIAKLEALLNNDVPNGCRFGNFIHILDEPAKSKLIAIVKNPNISVSKISELLSEFGFSVASDSVRNHRKKLLGRMGCRCSFDS
jgi:hypothetical protein